ncbi:MAG: hypothetical protein F6K16_28975 [Symploca sp. SIO2B6]|nr:hypothetical protein [Symploca sp. SIO2B6]
MLKDLNRTARNLKFRVGSLSQSVKNFSSSPIDAKNFIILTRERSGSTCLLDLLSFHSNILSDPHTFYNYTNLPREFKFKRVYSKKNIRGYKFKVQPSSFDTTNQNLAKAEKGIKSLSDNGIFIIHLERENLIKQAVSWLMADSTKKQNYRKGERPIKLKSMYFDPDTLLKRIRIFESISNFEHKVLTNSPHLYLSYEKDLMLEENHQLVLDKICNFLDIKSSKVITRYARLSSGKLDESISNYEEIHDFLKNTKYFNQLFY